jgi:hypothetical protein
LIIERNWGIAPHFNNNGFAISSLLIDYGHC